MAEVTVQAIRGRLLSFVRTPRGAGDVESYRYIDDGMVVVEDGRIAAGRAGRRTYRGAAGGNRRSRIMPTR